jgi:hypothetical protein
MEPDRGLRRRKVEPASGKSCRRTPRAWWVDVVELHAVSSSRPRIPVRLASADNRGGPVGSVCRLLRRSESRRQQLTLCRRLDAQDSPFAERAPQALEGRERASSTEVVMKLTGRISLLRAEGADGPDRWSEYERIDVTSATARVLAGLDRGVHPGAGARRRRWSASIRCACAELVQRGPGTKPSEPMGGADLAYADWCDGPETSCLIATPRAPHRSPTCGSGAPRVVKERSLAAAASTSGSAERRAGRARALIRCAVGPDFARQPFPLGRSDFRDAALLVRSSLETPMEASEARRRAAGPPAASRAAARSARG